MKEISFVIYIQDLTFMANTTFIEVEESSSLRTRMIISPKTFKFCYIKYTCEFISNTKKLFTYLQKNL